MNEKKISLSTFFLIIAIIIIVIMGYFIWKLVNKTSNVIANANELNKTSNVIAYVNEVNEKVEDSNKNISKEKQFTESEIKTSIQNYVDLIGHFVAGPESLLHNLGYKEFESSYSEEKNVYKSDIKYSEFKNKMLQYVTEEFFEKRFINHREGKYSYNFYEDNNGYLCYPAVGASGQSFDVEKIQLIKDEYYFATGTYYEGPGSEGGYPYNIIFSIANQGGKCVISYCNWLLAE